MLSVSYTKGVMDTFVGGTDARLTSEQARAPCGVSSAFDAAG